MLPLVAVPISANGNDVALVVTERPETDEQLLLALDSVKKGASSAAVLNVLGEPNAIIRDDSELLLSRMDAEEVWQYYHPKYATISAVVAFRNGGVIDKAVWKVWGTGLPVNGEIERIEDYWDGARVDDALNWVGSKFDE